MSDVENVDGKTDLLNTGEKTAVETITHGGSDEIDKAVSQSPDLSAAVETLNEEGKVEDAPQFEFGKLLLDRKQLTYLPLSVAKSAGAALIPPPPVSCCGLGYNMVGLKVSKQGTRDDYFANQNNGWTFDGQSVDLVRAWGSGHYRGEVSGGTSWHDKTQDAQNNYKANFPSLATAHGFSFTDAESAVVPYLQGQGGYVWTFMQGKRAGQDFVYDKGNWFVGAQAGVEFNIAEVMKLGLSAHRKVIPSGNLDNVPGGKKTPDHLYGAGVHLFYIIE